MKTALITGGRQGIGLGIALALQAVGFRVVLATEDCAPAVQAALALGEMGFSTGAVIPVDGGLSINRL
ncbi:MAG: SDR family NAD(P)-dependent oxidoreductase [Cypionkella sp.]